MYKYEKEFRKENPQTIGETDKHFDLDNYKDWLEKKLEGTIEKTPLENETTPSCLSLHVHNDIEEAAKWYKIPIALYSTYDVYIMQEDRCVFVGSCEEAINWIKRNEGKVCPSRFPLNGL